MDMPSFTDILQKLSVFKNNMSLLASVVVALVGALLFVPTQFMSGRLRANVQQDSITARAAKIDRLKRDLVTKDQHQLAAAQEQAHGNDANEISALAKQSTMRELLSYDIFPSPDPNKGVSGVLIQEFGQRFRSGIDGLIAGMNGRDCPTDLEITRGLEDSSARSVSRRGGFGMGMGSAYGPMSRGGGRRLGETASTMRIGGELDRMIVDQMCQARAASASVYVNPLDLSGYDYWAQDKADVNMVDAVPDAWYHQLGYWVIEDILGTAAAMNSGHENIITAPVKRILRVSFTMGLKRPGSRGSTAVIRSIGGRRRTRQQDTEDSDRPLYVLSDSDGLTETCTGRYSKTETPFDVIHFNVAYVVGAKDVLALMKELCSAKEHKFTGYDGQDSQQTFKHNQITILESKIGAINPNDMVHRYYHYGEESVVELDMICEYIFDEEGYELIKPEDVKKTLAAEDAAA